VEFKNTNVEKNIVSLVSGDNARLLIVGDVLQTELRVESFTVELFIACHHRPVQNRTIRRTLP
jgi:hypothetical protein